MTEHHPPADRAPADAPPPEHRSGLVALVGRPNAGKSTLLNSLLGQKLSITSPKPQTTRNRVVGIHNTAGMQVVLIDTPGLHKANTPLNMAMVRVAQGALSEVDAVCWLVDAAQAAERVKDGRPIVHAGIEAIGTMIEQSPAGAVPEGDQESTLTIALNKIDLVPRTALLPIMAALAARFPHAEIVPIAALKKDGLDRLEDTWRRQLPVSDAIYPPDQLTDAPERFVVAELIREKIFRLTSQEIPYSTAVEVERFEEEDGDDAPGEGDGPRGRVIIFARIYVERDSQKGIIIGRGGQMLKKIGTQARRDIQGLLGTRVHLDLHVSVSKHWTSNPRMLRDLGIE